MPITDTTPKSLPRDKIVMQAIAAFLSDGYSLNHLDWKDRYEVEAIINILKFLSDIEYLDVIQEAIDRKAENDHLFKGHTVNSALKSS